MVISEPVLACLESARARFTRPFTSLRRSPAVAPVETSVAKDDVAGDDGLCRVPVNATEQSGPPTVASSTRQSADSVAEPQPLSAIERRARAAALRGMLLARQRRFEPARNAFAEAVNYDPSLDLTSVPTFWRLERAGQEAAISAYHDQGREREAAMLAARIRQTFRPRLLTSDRSRTATSPLDNRDGIERT